MGTEDLSRSMNISKSSLGSTYNKLRNGKGSTVFENLYDISKDSDYIKRPKTGRQTDDIEYAKNTKEYTFKP